MKTLKNSPFYTNANLGRWAMCDLGITFFMQSGIYKITSPSGKVYIGQSVHVERRIRDHKQSAKSKYRTKLKNSFLKYGAENHTFEILEFCSINELNKRERYYQDLFDSVNKGLNMKLQATDELKQVHSEETKKKIGASLKGKMVGAKNPMFGKTGDQNPMFGIRHPQELIDQVRLKKIGQHAGEKNPMYGIRLTGDKNPFYGKNHDDKTKSKMSDKNHLRKDILDLETGIFYSTLTDLGKLFMRDRGWASKFMKRTKRYIYT